MDNDSFQLDSIAIEVKEFIELRASQNGAHVWHEVAFMALHWWLRDAAASATAAHAAAQKTAAAASPAQGVLGHTHRWPASQCARTSGIDAKCCRRGDGCKCAGVTTVVQKHATATRSCRMHSQVFQVPRIRQEEVTAQVCQPHMCKHFSDGSTGDGRLSARRGAEAFAPALAAPTS